MDMAANWTVCAIQPKGRMMAVEIYALRDPRDGSIRYIGKANDAEKRLKSHLRDARRRDTPVYRWIRLLGNVGMQPTLEVIDRPAADMWEASERRHIIEARERGDRLLNVADGGDEPGCSLEVRQANGRKVAASRDAKIWRLKRDIGATLGDGFGSNKARAKLRLAAQICPEQFGQWASVPDREENERGEPVGGYRVNVGGRRGASV